MVASTLLGEVVVDGVRLVADRAGLAEFQRLIATTSSRLGAQLVVVGIEAAGHHHQTLTAHLSDHGELVVRLLYPGQVAAVRKQQGNRRRKTDWLDAAAIGGLLARRGGLAGAPGRGAGKRAASAVEWPQGPGGFTVGDGAGAWLLGVGVPLLAAVVWGALVAPKGQVAGADPDPGGDRAGLVRGGCRRPRGRRSAAGGSGPGRHGAGYLAAQRLQERQASDRPPNP